MPPKETASRLFAYVFIIFITVRSWWLYEDCAQPSKTVPPRLPEASSGWPRTAGGRIPPSCVEPQRHLAIPQRSTLQEPPGSPRNPLPPHLGTLPECLPTLPTTWSSSAPLTTTGSEFTSPVKPLQTLSRQSLAPLPDFPSAHPIGQKILFKCLSLLPNPGVPQQ